MVEMAIDFSYWCWEFIIHEVGIPINPPMNRPETMEWCCRLWSIPSALTLSHGYQVAIRVIEDVWGSSNREQKLGIWRCLVNIQTTMENHHFQWVNPLFQWPFSIWRIFGSSRHPKITPMTQSLGQILMDPKEFLGVSENWGRSNFWACEWETCF